MKQCCSEHIKEHGKNVDGITKILEDVFLEYNWAGNVRELKHIVESMVSIADSNILDVQQLPAYMYDLVYKANQKKTEDSCLNQDYEYDRDEYNLKKILEEKEIEVIKKAMIMTKGNKTKAGKILGIPRQTLKYKIDKLNIIL